MKQPVPQLVGMSEYNPLLSQRADCEIYLAAIAQNTVGANAELKAKWWNELWILSLLLGFVCAYVCFLRERETEKSNYGGF